MNITNDSDEALTNLRLRLDEMQASVLRQLDMQDLKSVRLKERETSLNSVHPGVGPRIDQVQVNPAESQFHQDVNKSYQQRPIGLIERLTRLFKGAW